MNWRRFFDFRELRDEPKPFLDHLEDLRKMAIKMLVVLALMMGVAFAFQKNVVEIIERPLLAFDPDRTSLTNFGVADPLTIAIELSFYTGLVMAFPFLVFFLAEFVLPALTLKERRMLYPAAAVSFGLFIVGVLFAYFFVLPPTLDYFLQLFKGAKLEASLERAGVFLLHDAVYRVVWSGIRASAGGLVAGEAGDSELRGAAKDARFCGGDHSFSGGHYYADDGHADVEPHGGPDVLAL